LEIGFSAFFLNRSNRSGILYKAGPIGGRDQTGNYKIDVRFNKKDLAYRIEKIALEKDRIELRNEESIKLLKCIFSSSNEKQHKNFIFLDPPYFMQGEYLYLNFYQNKDHLDLSKILESYRNQNWLLTYDNCNRINKLYTKFRRSYLPMSYTLQSKRKSKEVMIFSDSLYLPKQLRMGLKSQNLLLLDSIAE
jgi:DNA adenine methylase